MGEDSKGYEYQQGREGQAQQMKIHAGPVREIGVAVQKQLESIEYRSNDRSYSSESKDKEDDHYEGHDRGEYLDRS